MAEMHSRACRYQRPEADEEADDEAAPASRTITEADLAAVAERPVHVSVSSMNLAARASSRQRHGRRRRGCERLVRRVGRATGIDAVGRERCVDELGDLLGRDVRSCLRRGLRQRRRSSSRCRWRRSRAEAEHRSERSEDAADVAEGIGPTTRRCAALRVHAFEQLEADRDQGRPRKNVWEQRVMCEHGSEGTW